MSYHIYIHQHMIVSPLVHSCRDGIKPMQLMWFHWATCSVKDQHWPGGVTLPMIPPTVLTIASNSVCTAPLRTPPSADWCSQKQWWRKPIALEHSLCHLFWPAISRLSWPKVAAMEPPHRHFYSMFLALRTGEPYETNVYTSPRRLLVIFILLFSIRTTRNTGSHHLDGIDYEFINTNSILILCAFAMKYKSLVSQAALSFCFRFSQLWFWEKTRWQLKWLQACFNQTNINFVVNFYSTKNAFWVAIFMWK